jgi:prepilin-type N-terminal cleavage/methylation domain-containing protein/prepilin-type processing-associated H-X9-DG protein
MVRSARRGFTLGECIVVVVIIGTLVALLLPATRSVRTASARMNCQNNLKQLMLGLHNYESAGFRNSLPVRAFPPGCFGPGSAPEDRLSWMVALLPYVEQDSVRNQFDIEKGYAGNLQAAQTRIKIFLCPSAPEMATGEAITHYVAVAGIGHDAATRPAGAPGNGFMGYDRLTSLADIKDGTSNTIALMETRHGLGPWARGGTATLRGFDPDDAPWCGEQRPFGGHPNGMQVAMADGSVRFFPTSTDPKQLAAAITIAGGEPVNLE